MNQKKIGQTPIIFKDQGGEYMIEIKKKNFEKINETIIITNQNKVNQRDYILELIEANENFNMQAISVIQEKLSVVKDKIRELTMPEDPLLGGLEDEDGDPFIEK